MAGGKKRVYEFNKYPKYKSAYIRAFDRMLIARHESGLPTTHWKTAEDVFEWWIEKPPLGTDSQQIKLYDENGNAVHWE